MERGSPVFVFGEKMGRERVEDISNAFVTVCSRCRRETRLIGFCNASRWRGHALCPACLRELEGEGNREPGPGEFKARCEDE